MDLPSNENPSTILAQLFDALSISFTYPSKLFFDVLRDGAYTVELKSLIGQLPAFGLQQQMDELSAGVTRVVANGHERLEYEYVALFDCRIDKSPAHLNGRLYQPGGADPIRYLQELMEFYSRYGIAMMETDENDQADHLSVQLEFLAYLFKKHAVTEEPDKFWLQGLQEFITRLAWVSELTRKLQTQHEHSFYLPLSNLTTCLLENCKNSI